MIRAETRLTPEMSTTEYIIVTSTRADVRPRVSRRDGRDHQLRHADRQRAHRACGDRRAARAAEREDPVEPPSACRPRTMRSAPARHRRDRGAAVARRGELARRRRPPRARPRRASTSGSSPTGSRDAGIDDGTSTPCSSSRSRRNAYSRPFVSSVPSRTTGAQLTRAPRAARRRGSGAAAPMSVESSARSSRRRSSPRPSRAGARRSRSPCRGSARSAGSRGPPRSSVRNVSIRCSMIAGARPSDGSSMTSSVGFVSSARPIASICCSPPESCAPPFRLRSREPREELVDAVDRPARLAAGAPRDHAQVLVDRERREQPPSLRHVADAELARSCTTGGRRAPCPGSGSSRSRAPAGCRRSRCRASSCPCRCAR